MKVKRKKLVIAVTLGLNLVQHSAFAQFGSVLELSDLNGQNGFTINGVASGDSSGRTVSAAGDINGDGIDDLIIGAPRARPFGMHSAGISYVVFGSSNPQPPFFDLTNLNGTNGFALYGVSAYDFSGGSVSSAGDVNDDGIDDLIIGADSASSGGNSFTGSSYVVFGSSSPFPNILRLSSLNGSNGITINGGIAGDFSGRSVSEAGDINNDGIDDLIIGAILANNDTGSSYVVFGSSSSLSHPFNLSNLNGTNGYSINGVATNDQSGNSVSAAGDINDDGLDDLIIGAALVDNNAGSSYVVFGSSNILPHPFELASLNGTNGFAIKGVVADDKSGYSVSSAGDVNGDGIDDLIIGAFRASPGINNNAGSSYVVFGSSSPLPHPFNLSSLNGSNGFVIHGMAPNERSGYSVSSAGDVNGDGIDDLVIGAFGADPGGNNYAGSSYVVFGSSNGLPNPFNLSTINGLNGFILNGVAEGDTSGVSVSTAGDVNGDGIDDLIIGANGAESNGYSQAGSSYVVFGKDDTIFKNGFD